MRGTNASDHLIISLRGGLYVEANGGHIRVEDEPKGLFCSPYSDRGAHFWLTPKSGQSYADKPFYRPISAVPSTAFVEGWSHESNKANGVVIDLSMSNPSSSPDFDEIRGWNINSWVDKKNPAHTFHYYFQYNQLNVVFAYDLLVEPIPGTDGIRCTFSALTDTDEAPETAWTRDKSFRVVALPGNLTPFVIKSGGVIAFTTLPLGPGKIAVVHYLRLTRVDLTPDSDSAQ